MKKNQLILLLVLTGVQCAASAHFLMIPNIFFKHIHLSLHTNGGSRSGGGQHVRSTHTTTTTTYTTCTNCGGVVGSGAGVGGVAVVSDRGSNCVGPDARIGDDLIEPDGRIMIIDAIDGVSPHCKTADLPIRVTTVLATTAPEERTTNARIDIPDGWEQRPLTDTLKAGGSVLYVFNKDTHSGLKLSTVSRDHVSDMAAFANSRLRRQAEKMTDPQASAVTQLVVNGIPSWRYEISGQVKTSNLKYMTTIMEGEDEAIVLSMWTTTDNYDAQRATLTQISDSVTGIGPQPGDKPVGTVSQVPGTVGTAVDDPSL